MAVNPYSLPTLKPSLPEAARARNVFGEHLRASQASSKVKNVSCGVTTISLNPVNFFEFIDVLLEVIKVFLGLKVGKGPHLGR